MVYQSSNSFAGLAQGVILYMSETFDPSCDHMGSTTTINSIPPLRLFRQLRVLLSLHVLCNLEVLVLPRNQLNIV
jgi:hypothetical protein